MMSGNRWRSRARGTWLTSFASPNLTTDGFRKRIQVHQTNMSFKSSSSNVKKANLCASRKEKIKLPNYGGEYHISEFLSHPSGIQAMLNTSALHSFHFLDTNTYRCTLPKFRLFNFEASPIINVRVTPTNQDCTVELLSCKFEGSDILQHQNDHFSAFMTNRMTWHTSDSDSFLQVDVKLNLSLKIYTRPFTLLPTSAVEGPGNLMMQGILDRLVPSLLQQLLQDYDKWVHQKFEDFS